jgi:hypothetical protein
MVRYRGEIEKDESARARRDRSTSPQPLLPPSSSTAVNVRLKIPDPSFGQPDNFVGPIFGDVRTPAGWCGLPTDR